ncbi:hypothetical protein [Pedobacter sp. Leaf250]|uniref:hypothetical protein n=1 Tax=Pedobacter sp. Leaf250 TaxID=2876559 RepID=UPI001E5B2895|nr:hypothetical protein [Pedobacter sp. Leaf250]
MKCLLPTLVPLNIKLIQVVVFQLLAYFLISLGKKKPFHFGKVFIVLDKEEEIVKVIFYNLDEDHSAQPG